MAPASRDLQTGSGQKLQWEKHRQPEAVLRGPVRARGTWLDAEDLGASQRTLFSAQALREG